MLCLLIAGPQLTAEHRQKLLAISMRCPVHLCLENGSHIETALVGDAKTG